MVNKTKQQALAGAGKAVVSMALGLLVASLLGSGPAAVAQTETAGALPAFEYLGSSSCKKCHLVQFKSWEKTLMANAFDLLAPGERAAAKTAAGMDPNKDYTADSTCLACHATGYAEPTGFTDLDATASLAGVGCEACHGAGKAYSVDSLMSLKNKKHSLESVVAAGLIYPVPESNCLTCHNDDHPHNAALDPKYAFDYVERISKGTHKHTKLKYDHGPLPAGVLFQEN